MTEKYVPQDRLFLWWLGDPAQPRPIGELGQAAGGRAVSLRYAPDWLQSGFALSEDLPLTGELFVPLEKDGAAGAVDDARPDRWGERVIRKFEATPRLSILEFLLFAGDDRYGALGVSQRSDAYKPWRRGPLPKLDSLEEMAEVVRKVLANEAVSELQKRLVQPGASPGRFAASRSSSFGAWSLTSSWTTQTTMRKIMPCCVKPMATTCCRRRSMWSPAPTAWATRRCWSETRQRSPRWSTHFRRHASCTCRAWRQRLIRAILHLCHTAPWHAPSRDGWRQ